MSAIEVAQERLAYAQGYRKGLAEKDAEVERVRQSYDFVATMRDRLGARLDEAHAKLAAVEALADEYDRQAKSEGYGGELWSTTASALRAVLAEGADHD